MSTVHERARAVFREVFEDDTLEIHDDMVASDVVDWDSFNHITLVMSLEEEFELKFPTREVMGWKNVGEMLRSVEAKLG